MYQDLEPKKPVEIALSFSGGGFRAAVYAVGCLSYLEHIRFGEKRLTESVSFISSASGGTITNLTYTNSRRKNVPFPEYYTGFLAQVKDETLANRVFEVLADDDIWKSRPHKSRNLINAFAIVYNDVLFNGAEFSAIEYNGHGPAAICANATEFDNGMLFRFQNEGVFGNKFLYGTADGAGAISRIKLGDILAASSCFPVGFEPLMYPRDFTHQQLNAADLASALKQDPRFSPEKDDGEEKETLVFGLMDGGIDDNQGIDSFIRAEERLQNRNGFGYDLYISCDVSSNYTSGFDFPEEKEKGFARHVSVWQCVLLIVVLFGLSLTGVLMDVWTHASYVLLGMSGLLLLLVLVTSFSLRSLKSTGAKNKNTFILLLFDKGGIFLRLRLSALLQMLAARGSSAGYLASTVFLKKIRRISYDRLFEKVSFIDDAASGATYLKYWKDFAIQNSIYLLSPKNDTQRRSDLKREAWFDEKPDAAALMTPSAALQEVAKLACEMDTTLWFDKHHQSANQPAALVATGQFTTCYNLLRYALRFDAADPYWDAAQQQLLADWKRFQEDPYHTLSSTRRQQ